MDAGLARVSHIQLPQMALDSQVCPLSTNLLLANHVANSCTERKIGCDKSQPSCNNCRRTRRKCLGYEIRLVWPDIPDGRRRLAKMPVPVDEPGRPCPDDAHYGQQFLNTSSRDIEQSRRALASLALFHRPIGRPQPCLTLLPQLQGQELYLLTYCKQANHLNLA